MTNRRTTRACGRAAAVALAAGLVFTIAGCGSGNDSDDSKQNSSSKPATPRSGDVSSGESTSATPEPAETLAQVKGEKGIVVTITKATRDSGGFVTVEGTLTNTGDESFSAVHWAGSEEGVQASGNSLAGAVLVDPQGKKRYYVLRDTAGMCLCTMKLTSIQPNETRPIFAQFPAPPEGTTDVTFELPTMPPANIKISG